MATFEAAMALMCVGFSCSSRVSAMRGADRARARAAAPGRSSAPRPMTLRRRSSRSCRSSRRSRGSRASSSRGTPASMLRGSIIPSHRPLRWLCDAGADANAAAAASARLREALYSYTDEEIRPYFSLPKVRLRALSPSKIPEQGCA
eukprot:2115767-Rhodomonas_salina.5